MIRFDQGNHRFNYRVVGIALHNNQILLHQGAGENFWTLPGGRVEFGEEATQTLKREMQEELEIQIEVTRLLWVVENFFDYDNKNYHELSFYFLMRLPDTSKYLAQAGPYHCAEAGSDLIFRWFPNRADVLSDLPVYPSFLQTELQQLPESTLHRIHRGK
jgi:ADP-ribose pyrophosphatase YjhB (NUDIX family)